jgi:hypothetical protein
MNFEIQSSMNLQLIGSKEGRDLVGGFGYRGPKHTRSPGI